MFLVDNGETPLSIPGIYPGLEQELVDLNARLDANSSGDHKEWLPQLLLDFIDVSFLILTLVFALDYLRNITFVVTVPFNNITFSLI
jgi:hypothetical protein